MGIINGALRIKTERNLLHKVSVKPFVIYRKDASIWYLKNHKFRKWYFGGGVEVKRAGIVVINRLRVSNIVDHFICLKRIDVDISRT